MNKIDDYKIRKNISTNLKYYMETHNINNKELSNILGVSESTVGKWLLMKSTPRMGVIEKMANYFQIKKSDLLENKSRNNTDSKENSNQETLNTPDELKILDPYNQLNAEGKEKAVSYTWDLVDSNKYIYPTRQEMITYLSDSDVEIAAMKGYADIREMTDDELKTLYTTFKEEDKWQK